MYCPSCGREIDNNAQVCMYCGTRFQGQKTGPIDNPSHLAGVVSCCFPIVGLILYFLWKDEKPNSAKLVCKWMIGGVVAWVLFYLLFFILGLAASVYPNV